MRDADSWMIEWRGNMNNPAWFFENASHFVEAARQGLAPDQPSRSRRKFTRLLASILMKRTANISDARPWLNLTALAQNVGLDEDDAHLHLQLRSKQAVLTLQMGDYAAAQAYYKALLSEAPQYDKDPFNLEARLGLSIIQVYYRPDELQLDDVSGLLAEAGRLGSAAFTARMQAALAFAYYYFGLFEHGIEITEAIYMYWEAEGNVMEMARTAYLRALLHRGGTGNTRAARYWLSVASQHYQEVDYPAQAANVANERGLLALWDGAFEEAVRWHRLALETLEHTDDVYRQTLVRVCLSIALVYEQSQLDEAYQQLHQALADLNTIPGQRLPIEVQLRHVLGFLEAKKGNRGAALAHLSTGRDLALRLDDSGFRRTALIKYDTLMMVVQDGDTLQLDLQVPWLIDGASQVKGYFTI